MHNGWLDISVREYDGQIILVDEENKEQHFIIFENDKWRFESYDFQMRAMLDRGAL